MSILPPPPVANSGIVCLKCHAFPAERKKLLRCGGCKLAFYCSKDCQAKCWKGRHSDLCSDYKALDAELQSHPSAATMREAALAYVNERFEGHPGLAWFDKLVRSEPRCNECSKRRGTSSDGTTIVLTSCSKCHWSWFCQEHEHLRSSTHDSRECAGLKYMNMLHLQQWRILSMQMEDRDIPAFAILPETVVAGSEDGKYLAPTSGWEDYYKWRGGFPMQYAIFVDVNTALLSQVMTVEYALNKFQIDLKGLKAGHLIIHVIGADSREFPATQLWEELMHLHTCIAKLSVIFIGPNVPNHEDGSDLVDLETCPICRDHGRTRIYGRFTGTYQDYLSSDKFLKPTLAIAFNSGMYEVDIELWRPALEFIVKESIPFCFTSYNEQEAKADGLRMKNEFGANILLGYPQRNPFHSQVPMRDMNRDDIYFESWYVSLSRGSLGS